MYPHRPSLLRAAPAAGGLLFFMVLPWSAAAAGETKADAAAEPLTVRVSRADELREALRKAGPGTRIEIAPGEYAGGLHMAGLRGEKGKPVIIAGADPANPPHFSGGGNGMHLSDPFFVELHHLRFSGAADNGLNLDDGGRYSPEPRGLVLRDLHISDTGPKGNHDAVKLSGIHGFRVENCVLEHWGTENGSGFDMVGCHDGLITGCTFRHRADPQNTGGSGIQAKGGTSGIVIRRNRFENAGARALNLGGSTGLTFFRPPLDQQPEGAERFEAASLTVEGNTITGSGAAFAFVGVDGAVVRFNTIVNPGKWLLRILQETKAPGFVPSRGGVITDNLIVFQSGNWSAGGVNVGSGTAPETFRFARNHWYCADAPAQSRPRLPVQEEHGIYGEDPLFEDAAKGDFRLKSGSPAQGKGAQALPAE